MRLSLPPPGTSWPRCRSQPDDPFRLALVAELAALLAGGLLCRPATAAGRPRENFPYSFKVPAKPDDRPLYTRHGWVDTGTGARSRLARVKRWGTAMSTVELLQDSLLNELPHANRDLGHPAGDLEVELAQLVRDNSAPGMGGTGTCTCTSTCTCGGTAFSGGGCCC